MATVSELITKAHKQVEDLRAEPYAKYQLDQTLDGIQSAIVPARAKVSEALTILRDPAWYSKPATSHVVAGDLLDDALKWLNGQGTVLDR